MRRALFLSIEGLGTNLLGTYGNSLSPTPSLDSFAAKSVVLDQLWADSPESLEFLQSLWSGQHARSRINKPDKGLHSRNDYSSWREALRESLLVTDSLEVAEGTSDDTFDQVLWAEPVENTTGTQLEQLVQAAIGLWTESEFAGPVLWIHSKGLRGTWDAPYEYRQVMCDEGDPDPAQDTKPIHLPITDDTDPDDVFRIACAVGGEAISIDETWKELLNTLSHLDIENDTLIVLVGTAGYPLGEHRHVGGTQHDLYAELLHVPCLMRFGNSLPLGIRTPEMLQPHEFREWLDLWFDRNHTTSETWTRIEERFASHTLPKAIYAEWKDQAYLATSAWSCRLKNVNPSLPPQTELFSKPDDRWEQNEISSRALLVAEKFCILKQKLEALYGDDRNNNEESAIISEWLDESLVSPSR